MRFPFEGFRQTFWLPARFAPAAEAAFQQHYGARFAATRRASALLGVLTWTAYLGLDYLLWAVDEAFRASGASLAVVRLAGIPVLALFAWASLHRRFELDERWAVRVIMTGCSALSALGAVMALLAPFPYDYLYHFQGIMVALVFCFGMFRLYARQLAILMGIVSLTCLSALWVKALVGSASATGGVLSYPWVATFLMMTMATIGYGISAQMEQAERRAFLDQQTLADSNSRIRSHAEEVERLNAALAVTMRESAAHSAALVDAQQRLREQAEQQNRDKSRFLAQAVHDLRQPLQVIGNALYPAQLAQQRGDTGTAERMVDLAQTAAQTLRAQLGAILDLSRLESGLVSADLRDVDLLAILHTVVEPQTVLAQSHGVSLMLDVPREAHWVTRTDAHFLSRMLTNLIANGIKYRAPKDLRSAEVQVRLRARGESLRIEVADNGIGIAPTLIDSGAIFEPFFQAGNELPESEKGVGLGLSIVRSMLALLPDHHLEIDSSPSQGSVFTLTCPRSGAVILPAGSADLPGFDSRRDTMAGRYVLLIDDDPLVLQSTAALFDAVGARHDAFDSFGSFAASIESIERNPDVLLTDYRLPQGRTGLDALLLARQHFPELGGVIFTGESADLSELSSIDKLQVLRKPLAPTALLHAAWRACA